MPDSLAQAIERQREEIVTRWAILARRPCDDGEPGADSTCDILEDSFDSLMALLRDGDQHAAESLIEMVAARGVAVGLAVAMAIRVFLAFKPACVAVLREQRWSSADLFGAGEMLDQVVGWAVAELGERYTARVEEVLAGQVERLRQNEERLLAQTAELAVQRQELERRVREIDALNRSAIALNASLELQKVAQVIVERAAELMETEICAIYEWDREAGKLADRAAIGMPPDVVDRIAAGAILSDRLIQRIIHEHHPIAIADIERATDLLASPVREAARGHGIRAGLAAPLVAHGDLFGYLATYYSAPRQFDDHEIALLSAFAEHAAAALENARLYAQARRLAKAEERNRLGREIHDTLAQALSGLVLQLQGASRQVDRNPALAREELREAIRLARYTLQEARRSVWELRARPLEDLTLAQAIRSKAENLRDEGVEVVFHIEGEPCALGAETEHNLLRIAQEALANVRQHARAKQVAVIIKFAPGLVELVVEDDGLGFVQPAEADEGHFGLLGMRDRARLLGGTLAVQSTPGEGTRIHAQVPVSRERGAAVAN